MELSDEEKANGLFAAARLENLNLVKEWLSLGADPLAEIKSREGENLLFNLYVALSHYSTKDRILEITEYFLNLPEYQELSEKSKRVYHSFFLSISHCYCKEYEITSQMLKLVFRFQDLNNLICVYHRGDPWNISKITNKTIRFNPGTLFVYQSLPLSLEVNNDNEKTNLIENLMKDGLSMQESPGCVTVLTTLMLYPKQNPDKVKELVKYTLKELSVNVESCTDNQLIMSYNEKYFAKHLEWLVPDALMLSLLYTQRSDFLQMFLPHWWGPPLALIYFIDPDEISLTSYDLKLFYPLILPHGGIPHGTDMFRHVGFKLRRLLKEAKKRKLRNGIDSKKLLLYISALHRQLFVASPMRLTDLAKYAVRHSFAKRAAEPDTNLPMLLKQNLPTLLYAVCTQQYQDLEPKKKKKKVDN